MNIYRDIADRRTLEREYSPSSCVTDIREFVDAYKTRSAAAREISPQRVTYQYGDSEVESLDFFPAPSTRQRHEPRPVLVYIHGGYWQELSKEDHSFPALPAARHDLSYVAVGYGLAPAASLDEMVERCRRAIAWLAQRSEALCIETGAIHLAGSSAGAHLAAMVALTDWGARGLSTGPIRSLTLLSGVYDLTPLVLTYVNDAVRMSHEEALRNSPALLIDSWQHAVPPALLAFGANETGEFKRQSRELQQALARKGCTATSYEIAERNHFDLVFDLVEERTTLGQLMASHHGIRTR